MSKNKNKNLKSWEKSSSELPPKELESLWDLSGRYKSEYAPDVEQGLSKLKNRINNSRQETPVVPLKSNRRQFLRIAAAIVFILGFAFIWNNYLGNDFSVEVTASNEQTEVMLDDGTVVVLNENSQLKYPESFEGNKRTVELIGEGYFDVAHNPQKPFIIKTPESSVKVLGTSFNVRAYPGETFTEVEVETGKVEFKIKEASASVQLVAHEKGIYTHGEKLQKRAAQNLNAQAWRTGELKFKDLPLSEAVALIKRHFNVEIDLAPELANCSFTSNYDPNPELEQVFTSIKLILPVEINKEKSGKYKITGTSCK